MWYVFQREVGPGFKYGLLKQRNVPLENSDLKRESIGVLQDDKWQGLSDVGATLGSAPILGAAWGATPHRLYTQIGLGMRRLLCTIKTVCV